MGTNYYHETLPTNHCPHCGRSEPGVTTHIGKSSCGWVFHLHVTDEIYSLEDWKKKFAGGGIIRTEYGEEITIEVMLGVIEDRSREKPPGNDFNWGANQAEPGPGNLVRSKIDGRHCVGHGEGTWDLIAGEFS